MYQEVKCEGKSVSEIIAQITDIFGANKGLIFRGHNNYAHKLVPSLFRDTEKPYNEAFMIEEFIKRYPHKRDENKNILEWLSLMQHYGLPTRLLDWTTDLLVALYFVVNKEEDMEKEGAIYIMSPDALMSIDTSDKYFPIKELIIKEKNLSQLFQKILHHYNQMMNKNFMGFELMSKSSRVINTSDVNKMIREKLDNWEPLSDFGFSMNTYGNKMKGGKPIVLESHSLDASFFYLERLYHPPKLNPRLIRQNGLFTIHSGKVDSMGNIVFGIAPLENTTSITAKKETTLVKINITVEAKRIIIKELELMGMQKHNLFPEMDYISEYIKEQSIIS